MSSPLFTADGRYAVVMYNDEGGAGRLPYDGYDIHAVLVVVGVAAVVWRVQQQQALACWSPLKPDHQEHADCSCCLSGRQVDLIP